ncbi:MAG TPA: outer membrane protein assembly factor BamA [Rhizomicrobium sp.]|nr:outer membrane protein assembly factor BamA [Rhizomicrobium sp.]
MAVVVNAASPAGAQALSPTPAQKPAADTAAPAQAPAAAPQPAGPPVRQIVVQGTQRIEPGTVLSYLQIRQGDPYDEEVVDRSLKTLFATGLFADVKFNWDGQTLTINVVESPIINQVVFEGESKVSEKDLTKEVQLKPRMVFTRSKVQGDVQRIIELYRRNGKFAASVDPQIIQRPQNRVDLIFSINEGPTTGVARIAFIGNKVFDDDTLREQIATEETQWWKFLSSNDNYDPDRLTFDKEQLRRFYLRRGYADFRVVSAVAELSPDRENFYITFTVDEGPIYNFGKVVIDSKIKELTPASLRPMVPIVDGSTYNAELIDKSIDAVTNAAGTKGYAFAEVHPRIKRDRDTHTIDVIFEINQGPRVYVEKINITGNTRTLDKVIRREFRLVEGDAFNRVLVDRSRTRIRALGFFKDVDIKPVQGSEPDKTVLNVTVTEQSTGELSLGAGYSSTSSFVGQFSYTQRNLFGHGQYLRASISASSISKEFQLSFTEPYFLDRPLAAGFDLYKVVTDFTQADYEGDTTAAGLRLGFPTSEFGAVGLRYTFRIDKITLFNDASPALLGAAGTANTSSIGYSYDYNTLDDPIKPTKGVTFDLSQDFAGFGGTLKYLRTEASFSVHHKVFWDSLVAKFSVSGGYIDAYGGQTVRLNERFFKGGDSFRGFALAGIGPRDVNASGDNAIGGNAYAIGTAELRLPDFLPSDYGISTSLFSDFGTLGHIDAGVACPDPHNPLSPCIKDNLALRVSAGLAVGWKSPFGPVEIDFGIPVVRQSYDKTQIIRFSAGTGL